MTGACRVQVHWCCSRRDESAHLPRLKHAVGPCPGAYRKLEPELEASDGVMGRKASRGLACPRQRPLAKKTTVVPWSVARQVERTVSPLPQWGWRWSFVCASGLGWGSGNDWPPETPGSGRWLAFLWCLWWLLLLLIRCGIGRSCGAAAADIGGGCGVWLWCLLPQTDSMPEPAGGLNLTVHLCAASPSPREESD